MRVFIDGFIADDTFQFVMDKIQDLIQEGVYQGYLESYPFYAVNFNITEVK